ncbi:Preprotein translocase subunit YajC (TC 3.A.5.1.1) [uncultured Gammaproteobacteria bacterium]|nr:Preprotein translocase subunit YajC (TC 3.A.5.1.1) [uncultured Gammaproteobacteria bacterium]
MNLLDLIISPAYAAEGINADPSALSQLIPLVLLFVVMYFLLIRPQQKRAKAHKALLGALKAGGRNCNQWRYSWHSKVG